MTKTTTLLCAALLAAACQNEKKSAGTDQSTADSSQSPAQVTAINDAAGTAPAFAIDSLPVSDKELGKFPYVQLPEDVEPLNKPLERKLDRLFFPINGVMTPIEGHVWKSFITDKDDADGEWSLVQFENEFGKAITGLGGIKVYDAKVSDEEIDRIKEQASYFGEEGSIDYYNNPVKVYVIRRADSANVYIQFSGNSASGAVQILQQTP